MKVSPRYDRNRQFLIDTLPQLGWQLDRFGHFTQDIGASRYRVKMQRLSLRIERRSRIGDHNEWLNLLPAPVYLKDIRIEPGKIIIGRFELTERAMHRISPPNQEPAA